MASSGLKKMFIEIISNTRRCHSVGVSFNFMDNSDVFDHFKADVMPYCIHFIYRQMLCLG